MDLSRYFVNEEITIFEQVIPKYTYVELKEGKYFVKAGGWPCNGLEVPETHVTKEWDNENRNRRYGVRRGDIVKIKIWGRTPTEYRLAEVVDYYGADNNAVTVKDLDGMHKGIERKEVAEWCEIVTKVEDR